MNQLDTMADYPTYIDSQPMPKIVRPISMSLKEFWYPPIMKIPWPKVRISVKRISPFLIPMLSSRIPPKSGKIQFGIA